MHKLPCCMIKASSLILHSCLITGGKHGFVTRLLDYDSETDVSQMR